MIFGERENLFSFHNKCVNEFHLSICKTPSSSDTELIGPEF